MSSNIGRAAMPVEGQQVPPPPNNCSGQLYTVRAGDTLFLISLRFGVTVEAIRNANPQITDPDIIFIDQVICVPPVAQPVCDLRVTNLRFLSETGQILPVMGGFVQLNARTIVRANFNRVVSRALFLLEPTGTGTCEFASLIGIDCPSAVTGVAEILWEVPPGTLGRVYVVACTNGCCARSQDVLVVRQDE